MSAGNKWEGICINLKGLDLFKAEMSNVEILKDNDLQKSEF